MRLSRAASAALVVANLLVVASVLRHQWGYYQAIVIFWCETVIIGFYNIGRMIAAGLLGHPAAEHPGRTRGPDRREDVRGADGVSFVWNFLGGREYLRANLLFLLFWPYARMALMLGVITLGLAAAWRQLLVARSTTFAVAVIVLKLAADLASHLVEHSRLWGRAETTASAA